MAWTAFPILFSISLIPGACMMLAFNLGVSVGVGRTAWMMMGELMGLTLVALASLSGAGTILLASPVAYQAFSLAAACYLIYIGWQMMTAVPAELGDAVEEHDAMSPRTLLRRGFFVALGNPKAWLLYLSVLPPFIVLTKAVLPQVLILVTVLLVAELVCLLLYASGGQLIRRMFESPRALRLLNITSGLIVIAYGGSILIFR